MPSGAVLSASTWAESSVLSGGKGMTSSDWNRTALSTSSSGTQGRSSSRVMARRPAMPTTTEREVNPPFSHRREMASATAEWSWTSPSSIAPGGRPTCPKATRTGTPPSISSSAARTALVPMSSPTT